MGFRGSRVPSRRRSPMARASAVESRGPDCSRTSGEWRIRRRIATLSLGSTGPAGIAQRQTAATYLKALSEIGVLDPVTVGREKLFINPRLMRLLTAERPGDLAFPGRQ
jgi:hypothetical protein